MATRPLSRLVGGPNAIPAELLTKVLKSMSHKRVLKMRRVCSALKNFIDKDAGVQKYLFFTDKRHNHRNDPIGKKHLVKFNRDATNGRHLTARLATDDDEPAEDERILVERIANPFIFRAAENAGDDDGWRLSDDRTLKEFTGHVQCSWDVPFSRYTAVDMCIKMRSYSRFMHVCWPPITEIEYIFTCDEPVNVYNVPIMGGRWNWEKSGTLERNTGIRCALLFHVERELIADLCKVIATTAVREHAFKPRITWKIPGAYDPTA
ncbi:hypothetical protein MBLNU13_g05328t1 [Cladosporium sp. NU13]